MPSITWNKRTWDGQYDWDNSGEEWSRPWGNSEMQWFGTLLPRVHAYLPAPRILEIAPGFGRWTRFLKDWSSQLVLVDMSEQCIQYCRQRFQHERHLEYHVNDGRSLAMVADQSIDFVFSFDSLVHANPDAIDAYLEQLSRKLTPNGVGFIHHSNLEPFAWVFQAQQHLPYRIREHLLKRHLDVWDHERSRTMSARLFAEASAAHGLQVIAQELVNWGGPLPIDAISTFTLGGSAFARPNRVLTNRGFMWEAVALRRLAHLYSFQAGPSA